MQMNVEEPQLFIQIEKCKNKVKKKKKKNTSSLSNNGFIHVSAWTMEYSLTAK